MSLFNNPKKTVIAVVAFLIIFVTFLAIPKCHADITECHGHWYNSQCLSNEFPNDPPYVQFSAGSTILRGIAPVLDMSFTEKSLQLRNAYFQEGMTLIGSSNQTGYGPAPNNVILRGLFLDGVGHFDLGLGVSWMFNPAPFNGSQFNFNLQADYRFTYLPITIAYDHFSNAGMTAKNIGRDMLMIGWRFH